MMKKGLLPDRGSRPLLVVISLWPHPASAIACVGWVFLLLSQMLFVQPENTAFHDSRHLTNQGQLAHHTKAFLMSK